MSSSKVWDAAFSLGTDGQQEWNGGKEKRWGPHQQQYTASLWHLAEAEGSMGFSSPGVGDHARIREPMHDGGGEVVEEFNLGHTEFEVGAKIRFILVSFSLP